MINSKEIKNAREVLKNVFEEDPEFKSEHQTNIAKLLYDHYDITDYNKRNKAAIDIINLIFECE